MAFLKSLHARCQLMEVNFVCLLFGPEKLSKNEAIFCFIFLYATLRMLIGFVLGRQVQ